MKIAVIPARGGSKRIPRKNVRVFGGKPMIAWSIEAAQRSRLFDHILVSTDDSETTDVANRWGAETPFVRPSSISDDHTGTTEVIAHATRWAIDNGWPLTAVCCIYATAPLLDPNDLERGINALEAGRWAYAFSVTDYAYPVFRAMRQHPEGGLEMIFPEHFSTRTQDLPSALHDAAQFYWGRPQAWVKAERIFDRHSVPVHIPRSRVLDIDTEEDWQLAERLFYTMGKAAT